MTLTVSPYLVAPFTGRAPQSAPPQPSTSSGPAAARDSVTLSPAAQQALANTPPQADATKLQSTLETILTSVQTSTGPTLSFQSTGKNLDQTC